MEDIERVLLSLISIKDTKITYQKYFQRNKKNRSVFERLSVIKF
nr:MAG TPA: hypothetical protein [Caudoviricetes sp.]DAQ96937.1 MAG TPA: hypothetical protein [Caudoviricetes sp.]